MEPRLKAEFWVKAYIRRCYAQNIPAMVVRHGDDTAGSVLVKLNQFDRGCIVFERTFDLDGNRAWMQATGAEPVAESEADSLIQKQGQFDPDIWVIEVEDPEGRHLLDDPIL